jgi:tRNA(Ile)-lysidine synthase
VWRGESVWQLPQWRGTFVFADANPDDPAAIPEALLVEAPLFARSRAGGERMRRDACGPSRTLKNLFQEQGVPAWKRDVPLLFSGNDLLFVPWLGVNRLVRPLSAVLPGVPPGVPPGALPAGRRPATRHVRIDWRPDLLLA